MRLSGSSFGAGDVAPGLAYLFIALMALTSNNASLRRLGPWWKRLHVTGLYVVFLVFFGAYAGRVLGGYGTTDANAVPSGSYAAHIAVFALLVGGLVLRVAARTGNQRRRASAS